MSDLEGVSERLIEKLREAGIENVERILELGEDKLKEIPGVGDKTATKIMEAAKDLFEEVEIEVPEGIELPTAIQSAAPVEAETAGESESETADSSSAPAAPAEPAPEPAEAPGESAAEEIPPEKETT